ncbi:MAG TPA: 2OG-Fe(II) oxygenase [Hyphomonas atlantica]|nr:2OG-Fe(II) oxygenase [Hyphomonas atlantica]|tara:strand:+ start:1251 stop:1913 length:663 start_codon:yes stop_codon:yes gene_type:complete
MIAPPPLPGDNRIGCVVDDLADKGWSWHPGLLPDTLLRALREEIETLDAEAALAPAGIGRDDAFQVDRSIRKTRITWLDDSSDAQRAFSAWAETWRQALNRHLMLGLFEFEACFAVYPEGGFYDRHLDSFEGARNRIVSLVVYLNDTWDAADGGALLVWPEGASEDAPHVATLVPEGGGVVMMLSETIPHAVQRTERLRYAIAGWWRVNPATDGIPIPIS